MQQKKINKLLENNNFRNNQSYIFGEKAKRKVISSFLVYKKSETYFKEKNPIISMIFDGIGFIFISFLNILNSILYDFLKVNKFISLAIISILYFSVSSFFILILISSGDGNGIIMGLVLFYLFVLNVLYKFIKGNLDLGNWKINFFIPYSRKISTNYKDNKSIEGIIGITKSFIIESKKKKYSDEFYNFIIIFIIIFFLLIGSYYIYDNIKTEKKNKIEHEKIISDLINGKRLLLNEKNKVYSQVNNCYEKKFKIEDGWLILSKGYIKNECEVLEKQLTEKLIKNRKNTSREFFEEQLRKDKLDYKLYMGKNYTYSIIYKQQIELHNKGFDLTDF